MIEARGASAVVSGRADHRALRAHGVTIAASSRRKASIRQRSIWSVRTGILVLNAGSSSLKLGVFDAATEEQLAEKQISWDGDAAPG